MLSVTSGQPEVAHRPENIENSGAEATAAPARAYNDGYGGGEVDLVGRFSVRTNVSTVRRLLQGEVLEEVLRELDVPATRRHNSWTVCFQPGLPLEGEVPGLWLQ